MKNVSILTILFSLALGCKTTEAPKTEETKVEVKETAEKVSALPESFTIIGAAINPEGVEYNKNDKSFFLSSLNAAPITKIMSDGSFKSFTTGEPFPLSTAGLQVDYVNGRLLAAGFNGTELMDADPKTKGTSFLRIYDLETGKFKSDVHLSALVPEAESYFANDVAVDAKGNAYISDWNAKVVYKVDLEGKASVFWTNETAVKSGPNGLDVHPDGYLLVSILSVNEKGLYADFGLVKVPLETPKSASLVDLSKTGYHGFDGMIMTPTGSVIGVTNDGKTPGGNALIELTSKDAWTSGEEVNSTRIKASTTVALTEENAKYILNQDFTQPMAESWTIQRIDF